jgi:cation:H+ antiporter
LPAIIYPISAHVSGLRRHGAIMILATVLFAAIAYVNGAIDTRTGAILFGGIILYVAYIWFRSARGAKDEPVVDEVAEYAVGSSPAAKSIFYIIAGLIGLPLGANLLVTNASALAIDMGVREELIGLTIIAFGTSLPELATVIAAALRKRSDVAMGSVIGSNIFNLLAVGGAAGLIGTVEFGRASLEIDIPVMIAVAAFAALFIFLRRDIGRVTGLIMCAAYGAFIGLIAVNAGV